MKKLWGGRFTKTAAQWVDDFGASIHFDQQLVEEDIEGSIAHVTMLGECGILPKEDVETIKQGLTKLLEKAKRGELSFSVAYEDIHLNIEKMLIDEIGPVGGKLHTGRSRNDQVATDMHLYLRKRVIEIIELIRQLQRVLVEKAEQHIETLIPGYTHLQRAQPISFAHHLMAYVWMFERDRERFAESLKRINKSPLGAGALAGTTFPIDRHLTARLLGFDDIYENSLDAVSDRDFIIEFLSNSSILMMHLSRFCEELILWSSQEFQFIEMDDTFATGSSIMPQKKNPDMAELIRGKTGRIYGHLMALLTVMKGLPLAYNKDMQEDKEGMFDAVQTVIGSLKIFAGMIETMTVRQDVMEKATKQDFSNATELADYLAKKGVPFREAHEIVGKLVLTCIERGVFLADLPLHVYQQASPLFEEDIYEALDPYTAVNRRMSAGGTGFQEVKQAIEKAKQMIEA
ncbi:argininosuccinate lyase [Anoxybacillus sp. LAT_35]|uniref:Argininosuccinate lyase n=1 Tax=Anoxybacillus flavithermus NBRC 109594 TaxID=1315967 RepID=R4G0H6_9BACL|nr:MULTISPECIES: argininosuccinate lyase [Anoxybacillus]MCG3086176.1 argininosuccinate lyase [Anoxybacillus sp. LAT27]MCG5024128.1 argininosuccinate lyase [Anoxybacillus flavithermus]MCG6172967.1 argininosuccinate lyase [Anoxybacillus sp. LAT_11]MCG6173841.1 argininosuccinate lyase [Anoxybacillus sp. LAT_31]MCG6176831.1 argininosuccinate lyase [Anoxybacillus sp. LAT_35]MCG6180318.1 argininosuccinate lyase [Anoxybacillus sp. LAT_33]MCG6198809.1 argininosuccinate lyase [Anoxybacillus sp. LAT_3